MNSIAAVCFLLLFGVSAWGWGRALQSGLRQEVGGEAYSVVLGLAVLSVFGGLGNALSIAHPPFLWGLLLAGMVLSGSEAVRRWRSPFPLSNRKDGLWLVLTWFPALVALVFLSVALLPSEIFNVWDDLHTYFARPVSMLATGTLSAGPLTLIGVDSLGAHAFFQAFGLLLFPLDYLNAFDAVLCLVLSIALAVEVARRTGCHPWQAVVVMLLVPLFHIQQVNISADYVLVMLVLALWYASCLLIGAIETGEPGAGIRAAVAPGLLLAMMVAEKSTAGGFAGLFWCILSGGLLWISRGRMRTGLTAVATVAGVALAAIFPWVLVHHENLLTGISLTLSGARSDWDVVVPLVRDPPAWASLLAWTPLVWGGSVPMYNLLAFTVFAAGGWAVLRMARNDSGKSWSQGLPIAALAFPATVLYLTLPMVIDVATAIRYVAPVLVGIAPPCLAMGLVSLRGVRIRSFPGSGIPLVLALVLFWLFLPVTGKHLIRMSTLHTTVSFPPTEQFAKTSKEYLSSAHCAAWRDIQEKTVAGEGILVRISTPYCADFKRNHIFLASDPGLVNPAIPLGPRNKAGDLAQWLTGMGVRYVLWESSGRAIKTNQAHNQSFQKYYWLPLYRRLSVANITFHQWLSELAASPAGALILPGVYLIDLQAGASPGP